MTLPSTHYREDPAEHPLERGPTEHPHTGFRQKQETSREQKEGMRKDKANQEPCVWETSDQSWSLVLNPLQVYKNKA